MSLYELTSENMWAIDDVCMVPCVGDSRPPAAAAKAVSCSPTTAISVSRSEDDAISGNLPQLGRAGSRAVDDDPQPERLSATHDDAIRLIYSSVNNTPKNPPFLCWFGSFGMQTDYRYCDMAAFCYANFINKILILCTFRPHNGPRTRTDYYLLQFEAISQPASIISIPIPYMILTWWDLVIIMVAVWNILINPNWSMCITGWEELHLFYFPFNIYQIYLCFLCIHAAICYN